MFEELKGFDSECGMRIQRVRRELMGEKLGNLCQMCNVAIIIVFCVADGQPAPCVAK